MSSNFLDKLLHGDGEPPVVRVPVPKKHMRHDYYAPKPQAKPDDYLRELLGAEHFTQPEVRRPAYRKPQGRTYSIGEFAKVLGRTHHTMRLWMKLGYLPEATHWSAGDGPARKRRYTEQQVMGVFGILSELGMLDNKRLKYPHDFAERIQRVWDDN